MWSQKNGGKIQKYFHFSKVVDLAAILGFHSMMTQDQWHESHGTKFAGKADANLGWDGITKATPLKWYPPEEPNR